MTMRLPLLPFLSRAKFLALGTLAVHFAGCASISEMTGTNVLAGDAATKPFYATAEARVATKIASPEAKGEDNPAKLRPTNAPPRSYSGSPDGLSLKDIHKTGGLIDAPRAKAYMLKIVDKLLKHWPYETGRIGIFIVNSPQFTALATPSGDILVPSGMLSSLESEDEVAAILGHELSHVLLSHHERAKQVADNKKMFNGVASAAVTYLMFSNTDWVKTGKGSYQGTVNTGSWINQSLQAGGACLAATYFIDKLVDPSWSRTQEDEADLLGIDLMIKAGYNPNAAVQAMRRRIEYEGKTRKTIVEKRQEAGDYDKMMSDAVAQQGIAGVFTGAARTLSAGVIDTFSDVDAYVTQQHRMSSDRLETMQKYLDRHYAMRERIALTEAPFKKAVKSGETEKTFENYTLALEASAAVMANDLDRALELGKRSAAPPTSGAFAPRFALYQVYSAKGEGELAFQQLLKVKDLDTAPPQYFEALAAGYAQRGEMQKAAKAKQRAIEKAKSVVAEEDKAEANFLSRLLSPPSEDANPYEVTGYCETLRNGVNTAAEQVSGRPL